MDELGNQQVNLISVDENPTRLRVGVRQELMEIPKTYPVREITRVIIKPSIQQISQIEIFKGLKYRYYAPFKTTESIIFEWDTEMRIKEKQQLEFTSGKPLMDENFNSNFDY